MLLSTYFFLRKRLFFLKFTFYVAPATNQIKRIRKKSYNSGELSSKHFCKNKILWDYKIVEISNFHFSHYKSIETISCHSNQSSYPTGIKNTTFVEGNVLCKYAKFQLHPPYGFWEEEFWIFFKNLPFMSPCQPIILSDLDKSRMKYEGLFNKFL